eukprot:CAMPEP_0119062758 /NCGR_PEP_ID=MMETSP1178-20130426/6281_1 /TAXON_ID=33656 /ORGANISM="unid sp, Strain CCMP2000" /LENGTH=54 /DNA_ID=CAMNT_0007044065 /DNA_START=18 /DNA_END=178 /DNA_ORIENTATION=-
MKYVHLSWWQALHLGGHFPSVTRRDGVEQPVVVLGEVSTGKRLTQRGLPALCET